MGENARPRIRHRSFCGQHGPGGFYGGVGAGQLLLRAPGRQKRKQPAPIRLPRTGHRRLCPNFSLHPQRTGRNPHLALSATGVNALCVCTHALPALFSRPAHSHYADGGHSADSDPLCNSEHVAGGLECGDLVCRQYVRSRLRGRDRSLSDHRVFRYQWHDYSRRYWQCSHCGFFPDVVSPFVGFSRATPGEFRQEEQRAAKEFSSTTKLAGAIDAFGLLRIGFHRAGIRSAVDAGADHDTGAEHGPKSQHHPDCLLVRSGARRGHRLSFCRPLAGSAHCIRRY